MFIFINNDSHLVHCAAADCHNVDVSDINSHPNQRSTGDAKTSSTKSCN